MRLLDIARIVLYGERQQQRNLLARCLKMEAELQRQRRIIQYLLILRAWEHRLRATRKDFGGTHRRKP